MSTTTRGSKIDVSSTERLGSGLKLLDNWDHVELIFVSSIERLGNGLKSLFNSERR
jgi:hypothetical protein